MARRPGRRRRPRPQCARSPGVELYRGRPILYDAGDFVDDYAVKPDLRNDRSVPFDLAVAGGRVEGLRLVPVEIANRAVRPAIEGAAEWLRRRMRALSRPLGTTFEREGAALVTPLPER